MFTATGTLPMVYEATYAIPDPSTPEGIREGQQLVLILKSVSDEKEYQFTLPITEKTPALKQLEEWQNDGKQVSVFASALRALPFVHDTTKGKDGNPVKRYQRPGRKVTVGNGVTVETDAFVVFTAYDVRLAGSVELDTEAQKAHGDYLKRQAEYRRRSVQQRVEKARQLVEERKAQIRTQAAQGTQGTQAGGGGATGATRKSA
jgi:hypothetical protein